MLHNAWSKQGFKHVMGFGFVVASVLGAPAAQAACGDLIEAPGKVFYVIPDGDLVTRELTLTVPECGQGAVALSSADGWRAETTRFYTRHHAGRTIFTAIFKNPMGDNPKHYLTLKGSYLRGKNMAKYWGDMYKTTLPGSMPLPQDLDAVLSSEGLLPFTQHAGGFAFKADVPASDPTPPSAPVFD
jgi:hypothetical protein